MPPGEPFKSLTSTAHWRLGSSRDVKTARWLLLLIPTLSVLTVLGYRLITTSTWLSEHVSSLLATELANRTHTQVRLSGVTFGWDLAPCFSDLELARARGAYKLEVTTKHACVERWASAVGSAFHAVRLRLEQPSIRVEGSREQSATEPLGLEPTKTATQTASSSRRAALREIQIVFDDLRLDWQTMPLPEPFSSGSFGPIDGAVTLQVRGGQTAVTASVREPTTGSELNARLDPTTDGFDLSSSIEGDLVPIFGNVLTAAGLDIRKMPTRGTLGAVYARRAKNATIELDLEQHGVDLANDLVSAQRLVGFTAHEKMRIGIDLELGRLALSDAVVEVNGIPVILSLIVEANGGSPAFDLRADLPTTPLLKLLRAVPGSRETVFTKDLAPTVAFALSFSVLGRLKDASTWQTKLEHSVTGIGKRGEGSGLEILNSTFRYYPLTKNGRAEQPRIIGPASPSWQPYSRVPYLFRRAVIVSEDSSFFFHKGIEIGEIQQAIGQGLAGDKRARGGSTITQQLVKNLFLTRDRTALRKLQEALLTFHLESTLTKEHIFELYVNIIEWGPNIYGIKEASRHYFGKNPEALNVREMAYLASIIPSPIPSHAHYEAGWVPARQNAKIDALLERLHRIGNISDAELEEAKATVIRFARPRRRDEPEPPTPSPPSTDSSDDDE